MVVVIERGVRLVGFMPGPIVGVNEKDVLIAVVVVIDEAGAAAHGFGEILLPEGSVVVPEVNAGLRGHVCEADRAGGARCCDGGRLRWHGRLCCLRRFRYGL